jgi:predicted nucleic acid-binding protein
VWYLDTSAFLKLVVAEDETQAMREWFTANSPCWSSQVLSTEALRAGARLGLDSSAVEQALDTVSLVLPSVVTFRTASQLSPASLRPLDALHLASALELGDDLEGVVTFDSRMIEAALMNSVSIVSPTHV